MSEIQVRLPDGKILAMPAGSTVLSIAEKIGKGLARAALAGKVDGQLVDLRLPLHANASVEIVTARQPEGPEVIRHSAEHVMADAVKRLFPDAQVDAGRSDHSGNPRGSRQHRRIAAVSRRARRCLRHRWRPSSRR